MEEECVLSLYCSSCIIYCPCLVEARLHDGWMDARVYFFQMFTPLSCTISFFFLTLFYFAVTLYHFVICLNVVFLLLSRVPYFIVHYYRGVRVGRCLLLLGKTHIAISSQFLFLEKYEVTVILCHFHQILLTKNKKSRPDSFWQWPNAGIIKCCNNDTVWKTTFFHSCQSIFSSR